MHKTSLGNISGNFMWHPGFLLSFKRQFWARRRGCICTSLDFLDATPSNQLNEVVPASSVQWFQFSSRMENFANKVHREIMQENWTSWLQLDVRTPPTGSSHVQTELFPELCPALIFTPLLPPNVRPRKIIPGQRQRTFRLIRRGPNGHCPN